MAIDKAVNSTQLDADLKSVADTIRTKGGTSSQLVFPTGFNSAIGAIDSAKPEQEKTLNVTSNGSQDVLPDTGKVLKKVTVNTRVPAAAPNIQPRTITSNGTYTAAGGVDGYSPVTVNCPGQKAEQEKAVQITANGDVEILPDAGKVLKKFWHR